MLERGRCYPIIIAVKMDRPGCFGGRAVLFEAGCLLLCSVESGAGLSLVGGSSLVGGVILGWGESSLLRESSWLGRVILG